MAARKTSARRRPARKGATRITGPLGFEFELPPTLRDYAGQLRRRLDQLERELVRAQTDVRRRAARLLREASQQLGKLEARGEAGWRALAVPYRRELASLLRRIEQVVAPTEARRRPRRRPAAKGAAATPPAPTPG
jgi:hypothetical protein